MSEQVAPNGASLADGTVSDAEQREFEAFVFRVSRLAVTSQYAAWEALVTDDMRYWVPAAPLDGAVDPDARSHAERLSYLNDNRSRLATRIRQLETGKRHAQTPPSQLARTVSNIEVQLVAAAGGSEYLVHATQVVYEWARQATGRLQLWPGRVTYRLRRTGTGELRMAAKTIELVMVGEPIPNVTFLL